MAKSSFEDCPYHCNNGKILDRNRGIMVDCPHCSSKRSKIVEEGKIVSDEGSIEDLSKVLGLNVKNIKPMLDYSFLIADSEKVYLDRESMEAQENFVNSIRDNLVLGHKPQFSCCIGLGVKGRLDFLAYSILALSYKSGLTISKVLTPMDFSSMLFNSDRDELEEVSSSDILVCLIPEGITKSDLYSAKGLMQTRGIKGNPTIFITTWSIEACSRLLINEDSYMMAKPSFVKYTSEGKKSKYIDRITGVSNDSIEGNNTVLDFKDL